MPHFKTRAAGYRRELERPGVPLDVFRGTFLLLTEYRKQSEDVDYADLCRVFSRALRRAVNPFRHRTVLEKYREPAQLGEIQLWMQLWIDCLTSLDCVARGVPEWHRTYDIALSRIVSALIRQLRDQTERSADGWTEAATICREWLDRNSALHGTQDYRMLENDYYFFDARAERARAQALLDERPRTPDAFDEIATVFASALDKMRRAERADDHPEIVQLTYFVELCRYRCSVLRGDFGSCVPALERLAAIAPNTKMRFLPYFGSADEIERERHFLSSFQALAAADISTAQQRAEALRRPPGERGQTVRAQILALRQVALEILGGAYQRISEFDTSWSSGVGLSRATRFIMNTCRRLARGEISAEQARDMLLTVFPLDAFPPADEADSALDPILQLPPAFKTWLEEPAPADERWNRLVYLEWQYAVSIAEYLCGVYNLQRRRGDITGAPLDLPTDFRCLGFKEISDLLRRLQQALGWEQRDLQELIQWYTGRAGARRPADIADQRADEFLDCIRHTSKFLFPHVVKVLEQMMLPDGTVSIRVQREWSLPHRELEIILTSPLFRLHIAREL